MTEEGVPVFDPDEEGFEATEIVSVLDITMTPRELSQFLGIIDTVARANNVEPGVALAGMNEYARLFTFGRVLIELPPVEGVDV